MVSKRSYKKISSRKTKRAMRGGSACAAARNATQTGGSLASSFVEDYANLNAQKQPVDEYTTKMGLPSMDNLKGGGCGCSAVMRGGKRTSRRKTQRGGSACAAARNATQTGGSACAAARNATQTGGSACAAARNATQTGGSACAAARNATQTGGSAAYNRVMSHVSEMKAPNMYQLTGGSKKGRKTKRAKGWGKQRGGSFWNFAGYGNINAGPAMFKNDHYFTKDTSHPSWKDLMDPPTKEKAGSGDKQDLSVGASYPFK